MLLQKINIIFNKTNIFFRKIGILNSKLINYENNKLSSYIINKTKQNKKLKNGEDLKINQLRALYFSWFIKNNNPVLKKLLNKF